MKKNILSHGSHEEQRPTSSRDERGSLPHSRSDEEKRRRRHEWLIQRELERQHEKLKKKKILEFELKRARELGVRRRSRRSIDCNSSKSKSRSRSLEDQHRRDTKTTASKPTVMSGKLDTSCGTMPIFKGPEGTQISVSELRQIKVDIHRNIPAQEKISELQRDIIDPADITIIRRKGRYTSNMKIAADHIQSNDNVCFEERWIMVCSYDVPREGSKPIFEREEIKKGTLSKVNEVEEHRTVRSLDNGHTVKKTETFKRRSSSSHSLPKRSRSPRPSTSRRSRCRNSQSASRESDRHSSYRSGRRRSSREKSRENEKKSKERESSRDRKSLSREHKLHRRDVRSSRSDHRHSRHDSRRRRSESRDEDESRTRDRSIDDRSESRNRGRERNRDRDRERDRERSRSGSRSRDRYREQHMIPFHCVEQVPYPIYYGPRPIMLRPMIPIRGQVPIPRGGVPPAMMGPMRPFPPRFIPPDVYRLGPPRPPNYRYGSMF